MSKRRVVLLPGDGIGPEVVEAARRVVEAAGLAIEWVPREIGAVAFEKYGDALPAEVLEEIRRCGVALKGPTTTPIAKGYTSANVRLQCAALRCQSKHVNGLAMACSTCASREYSIKCSTARSGSLNLSGPSVGLIRSR